MKTIIYYFTGTGNTLAVARDLAVELDDVQLVPLCQALHDSRVTTDADVVGIAFPVYFLDLPAVVREFVRQLRFTGNPYIFGLATCGERPGGALFRLRELLEENGASLAAGFVFVMPENYIGPIDLMGDAGRRQVKFAAEQQRIPAIAALIRARAISAPEGSGSALLKFGGIITRTLMTSVYRVPRRFHATASCNRCRICERICPLRNIMVTDDGVSWGSDCTQCYACIHWCPAAAIEIGGRTAGKERYHHPNITIRDMQAQRGEPR